MRRMIANVRRVWQKEKEYKIHPKEGDRHGLGIGAVETSTMLYGTFIVTEFPFIRPGLRLTK